MIKVTVKINGIEYSLKGREDENYLKEVAEYVNSKMNEIKTKNPLLSTVDSGVLAALNIADELYKADIEIEEFKKKKESLEERNSGLRGYKRSKRRKWKGKSGKRKSSKRSRR